MSLRRYFKPANKLPTADEQRSIKSLPCHLRSPDGKRKKFIRNWLQNHETQTLNCAIKTGPTVYMYKQGVYTYQLAEVSLRVLLALRIHIMLGLRVLLALRIHIMLGLRVLLALRIHIMLGLRVLLALRIHIMLGLRVLLALRIHIMLDLRVLLALRIHIMLGLRVLLALRIHIMLGLRVLLALRIHIMLGLRVLLALRIHIMLGLRVLLALRIHIMLATFLRDITATFLSVTDTYIMHIMRIDPGLSVEQLNKQEYKH